MKDKSFYILIVAMLLLSTMALMLVIFLHLADEKFEENIRVEENGITESTIPVRDLTLTPGLEKEYHVKLICDATGSYFIHIDFVETEDGGMKQFVDVVVEFDGEAVYEGDLAALLDEGVVIEHEDELDDKDPLVVTFRYIMPIETGNEAQGTHSNFDVHLLIEKS